MISPLAPRDGVEATRVQMPREHPSIPFEVLRARFPQHEARLRELFDGGDIVAADGHPVTADDVLASGESVWFHRDLSAEPPVPFPMPILYRDDNLVVVDKPHFLATIPRGSHVRETALVRLRVELGVQDLAPVHRLDRLTAGVLLFTLKPSVRRAYQLLFQHRRVRKTYHAQSAGLMPGRFPVVIESHLIKPPGSRQVLETDGPINARTIIDRAVRRDGITNIELRPETGKTHQLRVHLASIGCPIIGDDLYPTPIDREDDVTDPLRLLAYSIEFVDPISGAHRRFESKQRLW